MKAKIKTVDIDGVVWEKEGDFVFGAIGKNKPQGADIEVDFSKCTREQLIYALATTLVIAGKTDKTIPAQAVGLAFEQLKKL